MSILVENITKLYGAQHALDNLSFSVKSGEVVGFLGPNGAGKSTMMKILTCFIPATSGSAQVCGLDVVNQSLEVRAKVGYLPENNPLYPDMYIKEYLEFVAKMYKSTKIAKNRVKEMIEITGLTPEQHKKIGQLSKGFKQRVGLAQALIHDPEVLILDEPTSGLDPNQLIEIRNLIKETGKEKTILLSTHIMQEVEAMCDRTIIINKGAIVADASTKALSKVAGKHVLEVEFEKTIDRAKLLQIKGVADVIQKTGNLYDLHISGEQDIRKTVFQWAVENRNSVLAQREKKVSLEDVFHKLTSTETAK